jgi:hypothetical protein
VDHLPFPDPVCAKTGPRPVQLPTLGQLRPPITCCQQCLPPARGRKIRYPERPLLGRVARTPGRVHGSAAHVQQKGQKLIGWNRRRLPFSFCPAPGCIPCERDALRISAASRSISPRGQRPYRGIIVDIYPMRTVYDLRRSVFGLFHRRGVC